MAELIKIDAIIEDVKAYRKGVNHPWIFDENGNIKDDVFVVDVIPFLEEMKSYEVNIDTNTFNHLFTLVNVADNTYNGNCNVSNDIDYKIINDYNGKTVIIFMVHLYGDIRSGYTDYAVIEVDDLCDFFGADNATATKTISDDYYADLDMFAEGFEVISEIDGEPLEDYFYDIELQDLLNSIKEKQDA